MTTFLKEELVRTLTYIMMAIVKSERQEWNKVISICSLRPQRVPVYGDLDHKLNPDPGL